MSVSVNPPRTPVTAGSNGIAAATIPNVCKMPGPPAPFVPVPLPNIGRSGSSPKDYSKKVKIKGKKVAVKGATFKSMGDIASKGTGGGLISANTHGPTSFVGPGSMDVKVEGKNVQLLGDPMLNNCGPSGNPPNAATLVGVLQAPGLIVLYGDEQCPLCGEQHGPEEQLPETVETQADSDELRLAADRAVENTRNERTRRMAEAQQEADDEAETQWLAAVELAMDRWIFAEGHPAATPGMVRDFEAQTTDAYNNPHHPRGVRELPQPTFTGMLGVVRCREPNVYAGKSHFQLCELRDEVPAGWHTPATELSILDQEPAVFPNASERFERRVQADSQPLFRGWWWETQVYNDNYRDALAAGDRSVEPAFPPGQCAAQQVVLLALEHGCRPAGLTERWYDPSNPEAAVEVWVRDTPSSDPRWGEFGGGDAVPPCRTCQVILTMLMCPKERPADCEARELPAQVCRCT